MKKIRITFLLTLVLLDLFCLLYLCGLILSIKSSKLISGEVLETFIVDNYSYTMYDLTLYFHDIEEIRT